MIRSGSKLHGIALGCSLALVLAGALGRTAGAAPAASSGTLVLEILHTNDMHGHLRPGAGNRGGAGAIAAKIQEARQRARSDANYDCLVVDAGDIFGGTAEDSFSQGKMMTEFLAGAGYDVYTVGNHDFGFGLDVLRQTTDQLRRAHLAVLGANIVDKSSGQTASAICSGAILIEKKGVKVGIIGVTTPGVERMNLDELVTGLDFVDPVAIVKEKADKLTAAGADVIVMVSHVGHDNGKYVDDKKIAAAVPGVRVIIGGHSHTTIKHAFIEPTHHAVIVQTGALGRALGSLKLSFDATTHKPLADSDGSVQHEYELIDLKNLPGAHPLADQIRARFLDPIEPQLKAKVGIASETLYRKFYKTETDLGNLLADAVLEAAPGAQVALIANSDLRADMFRGDVAFKDVYAVTPFDNAVVKLKTTGKVLRDVLDDCYGQGRHFAQVAGMKVVVDSRKPAGQRIQSIRVHDDLLADDAEVVIATSDFIAQGKGGFSQFQHPSYEPTGVKIRDALIAHIQKLGTITDAGVPMGRLKDQYLSEEIGRVTTTFGTDMFAPGANLFDIVAQSVLGSPARGDLALIDSDEIHWRLSDRFPVVRRDLNELVPYEGNQLVTVPVTGQQLEDLFASFLKKGADKPKRFRAYIAGGQLVAGGEKFQLMIAGKPVTPEGNYTLVTYDHLLSGPRGFEALAKLGLHGKAVGVSMRDGLEAWIKAKTPIGHEDFPTEPPIVLDQQVERTASRIANFDAAQGGDAPAATAKPRRQPKAARAVDTAGEAEAASADETCDDSGCVDREN